jgi:sugar/nucleoside kinase (ribokinase family)
MTTPLAPLNPPAARHTPATAAAAAGRGAWPQIVVVGALSTDCVADRHLQGRLQRRKDTARGWVLQPGTQQVLTRGRAHEVMTLAHDGRSRVLPGGGGYRIAEALTGLGLGLKIGFVGVLGSGDAAEATASRMRQAGIDDRYVAHQPREPMGFTLHVSGPGGYTVLLYPGANLAAADQMLAWADTLIDYLADAQVVYIAPLPGRHTAARLAGLLTVVRACNPDGVLVLDPGLDPATDPIGAGELLRLADVVVCDYHRLALLSGLPAGSLHDAMAALALDHLRQGAALLLHRVHQVLTWQYDAVGVAEAFYRTGVGAADIVETFGLDEAFTTGLLASIGQAGRLTDIGMRLATAMLRHRLTHADHGPGDLASLAQAFLPTVGGAGHPAETRWSGAGRDDPRSGSERP